MNAGVYFFKKKFLDFIKNKKESLENDILPKLILNNNIKGYYTTRKFIDIGSIKNLNYLKRNKKFLLWNIK